MKRRITKYEVSGEETKEKVKEMVVPFRNPEKDAKVTRDFYELTMSYEVVFTPEGEPRRLHSHTRQLEHSTIRNALTKTNAKQTLEIGFAYGVSALIFAEYHQSKKHEGISHTIIDPNQFGRSNKESWEGVGAENLKRVGFVKNRNYRLIEDYSYNALPVLLDKFGEEYFDVIFIDGGHNFDDTLLDVMYGVKLLKIGGIMIVDDKRLKAVNAVSKYIKRSYKHVVDICPTKCQSHLVLEKKTKDLRLWPEDERINYNLADK